MDFDLAVGFTGGVFVGLILYYLLHRFRFCIRHDYRLIAILPKNKGVMIECKKCGKAKSVYINSSSHNGGPIWADREYLNDEKWNEIKNLFQNNTHKQYNAMNRR